MSTEPMTVTASGPADFVTLVPRMLGFKPQDSVVVVPFSGTRSIGAVRVDLPEAVRAAECAHVISGLLCKIAGVTGVALVVYGERERAGIIEDALKIEANKTGLTLVEALYVVDDGWGFIGDERPPVPLQDVSAELAALPMEVDQCAGATLPETESAFADAVAASLSAQNDDEDDSLDLVDLFESALSWDPAHLEVVSASALIALLARPSLRDVGLVHWSHGRGAEALDAQRKWQHGAAYPRDLASLMWGEGPRPEPQRLFAALELCRHLASATPDPLRVGPLSVAAWFAWALGKSTHASIYAAKALKIDPAHGLSEIVTTFVESGHLPEWATAR